MKDHQRLLQALLLKIPRGKVTTYKEIAHAMDMRGYRFVGQLLKKNQFPDRFPCYKVVRSNGHLGGYALGETEKLKRLRGDGITVENGQIVDFAMRLHTFYISAS